MLAAAEEPLGNYLPPDPGGGNVNRFPRGQREPNKLILNPFLPSEARRRARPPLGPPRGAAPARACAPARGGATWRRRVGRRRGPPRPPRRGWQAGGRQTCASGSGPVARAPPRPGRGRCRYAAAPAPRLPLGCGLAPPRWRGGPSCCAAPPSCWAAPSSSRSKSPAGNGGGGGRTRGVRLCRGGGSVVSAVSGPAVLPARDPLCPLWPRASPRSMVGRREAERGAGSRQERRGRGRGRTSSSRARRHAIPMATAAVLLSWGSPVASGAVWRRGGRGAQSAAPGGGWRAPRWCGGGEEAAVVLRHVRVFLGGRRGVAVGTRVHLRDGRFVEKIFSSPPARASRGHSSSEGAEHEVGGKGSLLARVLVSAPRYPHLLLTEAHFVSPHLPQPPQVCWCSSWELDLSSLPKSLRFLFAGRPVCVEPGGVCRGEGWVVRGRHVNAWQLVCGA